MAENIATVDTFTVFATIERGSQAWDYLAEVFATEPGWDQPHKIRLAVDPFDGFKFKVNEATWTPPLEVTA